MSEPGVSSEPALVPFLSAQRFQLPAQINIVAVRVERMDEFRERLA